MLPSLPTLRARAGAARAGAARAGVLAVCLAGVLGLAAVAPAAQPPPTHRVSGVVTYADGYEFTVQTAGRRTGVLNAVTLAANEVARHDYPYVWGGGHAEAGVADTGETSGRGKRRTGYDCSGSVAAVLAGAGLWPPGSGVPNDAGVISQLLVNRLIAPGASRGATGVTLYDHRGVHIFMNINGRFFGTSDGGRGANPAGGAGWLSDGAPDAFKRSFKQYHILPAVLRDSTVYGHSLTFQNASGQDLSSVGVGDNLNVSYAAATSGLLVARTVAFAGAATVTGTVLSLAADGSAFAIRTPGGAQLTLSATKLGGGLDALQVGDTVQITYTKAGSSALLARAVTVTATPPPVVPTGTGSATAANAGGYGG